jgi:hypothetical protein
MFRSASELSNLADDGSQRLLRGVGVDSGLAGPASPGATLDAPAEKVEPLVDVADPRLLDRQA